MTPEELHRHKWYPVKPETVNLENFQELYHWAVQDDVHKRFFTAVQHKDVVLVILRLGHDEKITQIWRVTSEMETP